MGKLRIPDRISELTDVALHFGLPGIGRASFYSTSAKSYSELRSSKDGSEDETTDIGYESSWSEIFRATNGVTYIKRQ